MFDVNLACDEEARQVLQAGLTDPHIKHAVSSLKALRQDLETSREGFTPDTHQTSGYSYGVQEYNMALGGLAAKLSSPGPKELKSALLCCQIFISIEQVRANFAIMAQHIILGLRIVRQYRVRPELTASNGLVPAYDDQLPLLDVFIIKQFDAPCRWTDSPSTGIPSSTASPVASSSSPQESVESHNLCTIAPNMRTELTRIAASALEFLSQVSRVQTKEVALRLLSKKEALLESLDRWLVNLELLQAENDHPSPELISVSFMRIFHSVLNIVLLGALDSSPSLDVKLRTEDDRLQGLANSVGERLGAYDRFRSPSAGQQERSRAC